MKIYRKSIIFALITFVLVTFTIVSLTSCGSSGCPERWEVVMNDGRVLEYGCVYIEGDYTICGCNAPYKHIKTEQVKSLTDRGDSYCWEKRNR